MHGLLLTGLLFTNAGEAQWTALGEAIGEAFEEFDLDLRIQGQVTLTAGFADADTFDSLEVEANGSVWGLGAVVAAGYDRLEPDGRGRFHAGHARLAVQWRPLTLIDGDPLPFHWFDPSIEFGGSLGGFEDEAGDTAFAGYGYLGAGLDLRVLPSETHLVVTVRYRWTPEAMRDPDGLPQHHLLVGLGVRTAD